MRTITVAVVLTALLAVDLLPAAQQKKKNKDKEEEPVTQVLELPKDPPAVVTAETSRLVFHVSPLSAKGLLSQQAKDALKALLRSVRGASIVKLRAFVAGTGDVRRVQTIVSEEFTEKRLPLPVVSVVQVGGLPLTGAQVVIESVAVAKKPLNPHGLAFISGQAASADEPTTAVGPLVQKASMDLRTAVKAAGMEPADVLRVTCFFTAFDDVYTIRARMAAEYPKAALNLVQTQRAPARAIAECEAVGRLRAPPARPLAMLNPDGLPRSEFYSQISLVGAPKVVFTGGQLAFGFREEDARLAFERLGKTLSQAGASFDQLAMSSIYPLTNSIGTLARKVRMEFYNRATPPPSTMLPFEGLPSLDASFAVEVVAVSSDSQ
jgi:enamine deaminase RidA (YjgF/YER057c/UK114 family)